MIVLVKYAETVRPSGLHGYMVALHQSPSDWVTARIDWDLRSEIRYRDEY